MCFSRMLDIAQKAGDLNVWGPCVSAVYGFIVVRLAMFAHVLTQKWHFCIRSMTLHSYGLHPLLLNSVYTINE